MLKVKKYWYHLLQTDAISFFVTSKRQKIQKIEENWWKELIQTEKIFISSERRKEFQWNF